MANPMGVFEDIQTTPRRPLFTLLGVRWLATPYAVLSIPIFVGLGVVIGLVGSAGETPGTSLLIGLVYGLLLFLMNVLHSLGHILSGKLVGAPMDANLVTATRHINIYDGPQDGYPRRVHLGRALGGPLMNILVGIVTLIVWALVGGDVLRFFAVVNLVAGIGSLAPVRSVDGEVIWRELRA
ncbi:MAG: hypothetical protein JXJ20_13380 [Anaerolineae bacterium]|jgi:hypothetical protein|nr:hypothetical protein [Anaerolineae bacterium]